MEFGFISRRELYEPSFLYRKETTMSQRGQREKEKRKMKGKERKRKRNEWIFSWH